MKSVDLASTPLSLQEALEMAAGDNLLVRTAEGREFVVAELDDFDRELELTRSNDALLALLDQRAEEPGRVPIDQVRARLGLGQ